MHLIGINGYRGSGKNTVGNIIAGVYGDGGANVKQVGFADKLKVLAALSMGCTGDEESLIEMMDVAKETWAIEVYEESDDRPFIFDLTGRQLLQNLGNHARKVFGRNFWIDQVLPNPFLHDGFVGDDLLDRWYPDVDCLVVTDVRYTNEALRIHNLDGKIWRVNRPGIKSDGHASEIPLDDKLIHHEIDNSGDLAQLQSEVERALEQL